MVIDTAARVGMVMAIKPSASVALADIPGEVVQVWPPFGDDERLVTLRYSAPVGFRNELITHIDTLSSDLYPIRDDVCGPSCSY